MALYDLYPSKSDVWIPCLDISDSMGPLTPPLLSADGPPRTRLEAAKNVISLCLNRLIVAHQDNLAGMVAFHNEAQILAPLQLASDLLRDEPWKDLSTGGLTNFTGAIDLALSLLRDLPQEMFGFRKIVLVTDGAPNMLTEALETRVRECKKLRIRIDSVCIGNLSDNTHYNPEILMDMAKQTRGWCSAVQDFDQLVKAMTNTVTVA